MLALLSTIVSVTSGDATDASFAFDHIAWNLVDYISLFRWWYYFLNPCINTMLSQYLYPITVIFHQEIVYILRIISENKLLKNTCWLLSKFLISAYTGSHQQ